MPRMANVLIREAQERDLPAIVAIYNEGVASGISTADTSPATVASHSAWFKQHSAKRPVWVAEREGQVAGWLSFQDFYGRPAYHITAELSVYVAGRFQRQGVGRLLLAEAVQRASGLGLHNLLGFVFDMNGPSIALFERQGFTRWGNLQKVAVMNGRECGVLILGLRVGG